MQRPLVEASSFGYDLLNLGDGKQRSAQASTFPAAVGGWLISFECGQEKKTYNPWGGKESPQLAFAIS